MYIESEVSQSAKEYPSVVPIYIYMCVCVRVWCSIFLQAPVRCFRASAAGILGCTR